MNRRSFLKTSLAAAAAIALCQIPSNRRADFSVEYREVMAESLDGRLSGLVYIRAIILDKKHMKMTGVQSPSAHHSKISQYRPELERTVEDLIQKRIQNS